MKRFRDGYDLRRSRTCPRCALSRAGRSLGTTPWPGGYGRGADRRGRRFIRHGVLNRARGSRFRSCVAAVITNRGACPRARCYVGAGHTPRLLPWSGLRSPIYIHRYRRWVGAVSHGSIPLSCQRRCTLRQPKRAWRVGPWVHRWTRTSCIRHVDLDFAESLAAHMLELFPFCRT